MRTREIMFAVHLDLLIETDILAESLVSEAQELTIDT